MNINNVWNDTIENNDYSKEVLIWYNDTLQVLHEINNYNCFRLILIEEGTGIANLGGTRISFTAPAVFCLDETVKLVLEKSANISLKYIYFFPMAMNSRLNYQNLRDENSNLSLTERNDRTYLRPFFLRTEGYYGFMDIGVNMAKKLSQLFERIKIEISEKKDDYWPCNSRSYFLELLLCVERHYSKHLETNYVLLYENASEIDDVLLYLHLNYSKKITLTGLTRQFNINRTSLNEQFTKVMNMSVMAYLIKFRIKLASMLLRDTMIPVSEVAARVGFGDTANFNRSFKKHTGLKPTDYRQQNCWLINQ